MANNRIDKELAKFRGTGLNTEVAVTDAATTQILSNNSAPNNSFNVTLSAGPQLDAFSRLRVSESNIFFSSALNNSPRLDIWSSETTNASVTWNQLKAANILTTDGTLGSKALVQSKRVFQYVPGQSLQTFITAVPAAPLAQIKQQWGLFDETSGVFFSTETSQVAVNLREAGVTTTVLREDWNQDRLDGTGPSGLNIDFTRGQIYTIDYEWLGFGIIRFGIVANGKLHYCHFISNLNELTQPYTAESSFPVRFEIENIQDGNPATLQQQCVSIGAEGNSEINLLQIAASRGSNEINVGSQALIPIIAVRIPADYSKTEAIVTGVSLNTTSNTDCYWELLINPTLTGGSWSTINSLGILEQNIGATAVAGGYRLDAGFFSRSTSIPVTRSQFRLSYDNLLGIPGVAVLAARAFGGNANVTGIINLSQKF